MTSKFFTDMRDVVDELKTEGDGHISFLKLPACQSNEKQIGHPTAEAYVSRGEMLITKIEQLMGWKAGEEAPVVTTPAETTTAAPVETTTEAPATTPSETQKEEKGCGSVVAAPAVAAVAAAAVIVSKKKRKEND